MNVHFSYKIEKTAHLQNLLHKNIEKLQRYLQVFRPELVHLKGILGESTAKEGYTCSLNLRLPSGQMASQESGPTVDAAVKAAFDALTGQLKVHKELLRSRHKWPRRRGPGREVGTVPFEETVAAIKPEQVSAGDISNYINANLPRLKRFVERELDYRQGQGQLEPDQVAVEDVVGEAIASALGENGDRPERIKLEPWLYRLATEAIHRMSSPNGSDRRRAAEPSYGTQAVPEEREIESEETLYSDSAIPDPHANNPEEIAARRELIGLVERTLRDAGRNEREAFILFTVEGFTLDEIADITNRPPEEVRASIRSAREHLERALPLQDSLKDKLVEYSKSA